MPTLTQIPKRGIGLLAGVTRRAADLLDKAAGQDAPEPKAGIDDVTLARKVETEIFRIPKVSKGKIDVNAAGQVVWLRGEASNPAQINAVLAAARAVPEVQRVENLLHLPHAAPASKRDIGAAAKRKNQPRRVEKTAERKSAATSAAQPTPAELAGQGKGRQPAPLGSKG